MEELCRSYWYPLYAHARSRGCTAEDAEDLTQTFFAQMLARETMSRVSPDAGRLRSYLLSSLNNLIAQDWRNRSAQKRGGGVPLIPIDQAAAEVRYARELTDPADPDREFNRRWALALLDSVMLRLRTEYLKSGQSVIFEAVAPFVGGSESAGYQRAAAALGISEGNLRVMVFRLRKRYRKFLREEILETVSDPALVDGEIAALFAAVTRP